MKQLVKAVFQPVIADCRKLTIKQSILFFDFMINKCPQLSEYIYIGLTKSYTDTEKAYLGRVLYQTLLSTLDEQEGFALHLVKMFLSKKSTP